MYIYIYMLFKKNIHFINIFCPKGIFHLRKHEVLSKKIKKTAWIFFPEEFVGIRRLFLSYHLPGKSIASTGNKYQKHKNA